ncbi:hypothetical protein AB837_00079 [bacterium AB1]|nr:hypothetical protein AB837_00079 [bacterium AB1]
MAFSEHLYYDAYFQDQSYQTSKNISQRLHYSICNIVPLLEMSKKTESYAEFYRGIHGYDAYNYNGEDSVALHEFCLKRQCLNDRVFVFNRAGRQDCQNYLKLLNLNSDQLYYGTIANELFCDMSKAFQNRPLLEYHKITESLNNVIVYFQLDQLVKQASDQKVKHIFFSTNNIDNVDILQPYLADLIKKHNLKECNFLIHIPKHKTTFNIFVSSN